MGAFGEKPCVTTLFDLLTFLVSSNHLFSVLLIGWGSYCWKWWVAGLSIFATRPLHQPFLHLHMGKRTTTTPLSWPLGSLSCRDEQGVRMAFLTQSGVKKGGVFLVEGSFSLLRGLPTCEYVFPPVHVEDVFSLFPLSECGMFRWFSL